MFNLIYSSKREKNQPLKKGEEMLKKILIAGIVLMAFVATSYAQMAVGVRVPFMMDNLSYENGSTSEKWFGVEGTFEYAFMPILAADFSAGYYMSLGGEVKYNDSTVYEFKNNCIPITLMLKFYIPMGGASAIHPYLAGGPEFCYNMITETVKVNDDYEDASKTNQINFGAPNFIVGFDYDFAAGMKAGLALSTAFDNTSYTPEGGDASSMTGINIGAALTLKYGF